MCQSFRFDPIPRTPDQQRLDLLLKEAVSKVIGGENTPPPFVPASGDVFMDQDIEPVARIAWNTTVSGHGSERFDRFSPEADDFPDPD